MTPLAGSEPFEYLGSAATYVLYADLPALEPAIAERSRRLRRPGVTFGGEIRVCGLRRLLTRRISARIATGEGLDGSIVRTSPAVQPR